MARLQILELPEGAGDQRAPFVLVVDECESPTVEAYQVAKASWEQMAQQIGAQGCVVTTDTIDIPGNDVPVGPDGLALKVRVEGDFEQLREQVQEEALYAQGKATRALDGQRLASERTDIARDMDRLAKWKNELTDALGMDRLRDWDDIRNAARGIREQRDAQAKELERLRAGEEPGWDPHVEPTPGQWMGRWNEATPEQRLDMAAQILDGMKRSAACFQADHEGQIARLKARAEGGPEEA